MRLTPLQARVYHSSSVIEKRAFQPAPLAKLSVLTGPEVRQDVSRSVRRAGDGLYEREAAFESTEYCAND
jgi:hypothetical protein